MPERQMTERKETSRTTPGPERLSVLLKVRPKRTQILIGVLCMALGFAFALQVRSNQADDTFETAREDELVGVLDTLSERSDRLRDEIQSLEETRRRIESGSRERQALIEDAREQANALGILAGTVPATGPGVVLTIEDPRGRVKARVLLDAVQELRDAGAEAMQIDGVRVVASTYFVDNPGGGILIDGRRREPPYEFRVIGDPATMAAALEIPGGVVESIRQVGARGVIDQKDRIEITALREQSESQYARPSRDRDPSRGWPPGG